MDLCHPLLSRYPHRELEIHFARLRDAGFGALCSDHCEAVEALRAFRACNDPLDERIRDFEALLAELEAKITDRLDRLAPRVPRTD